MMGAFYENYIHSMILRSFSLASPFFLRPFRCALRLVAWLYRLLRASNKRETFIAFLPLMKTYLNGLIDLDVHACVTLAIEKACHNKSYQLTPIPGEWKHVLQQRRPFSDPSSVSEMKKCLLFTSRLVLQLSEVKPAIHFQSSSHRCLALNDAVCLAPKPVAMQQSEKLPLLENQNKRNLNFTLVFTTFPIPVIHHLINHSSPRHQMQSN